MKRYRQKKKAAKELAQVSAPKENGKKQKRVQTRQEALRAEQKRERDRFRKREARTKLTKEQIAEINRRRREKTAEKRAAEVELLRLRKEQREERMRQEAENKRLDEEKKRLIEEKKRLEEEVRHLDELRKEKGSTPTRSNAARRKSLSRAFSVLPKSPTVFADTIEDLVAKASPRKKNILKKKGLRSAHREVESVIAKEIEEQLHSLRNSKRKKDVSKKREIVQVLRVLKKHNLQAAACRKFKVAHKTIRKHSTTNSKKYHKSAISQATKDVVAKFYINSAIQLPDKKYISKKTLLKTDFLQDTLSKVHLNFRKAHPNTKIGLKKFCSLRPKHIKLVGSIKYRGCLCEYCTNIDLKVAAINKAAHSKGKSSKFQGVHGVSKATLCPKIRNAKHYKRACIERRCSDCGTSKLVDHLKDIHQKEMKWKKWEKVVSNQEGTRVTKQEIVTKTGLLSELVQELRAEAEPISKHLFNAYWQDMQFKGLAKNLPAGWVVLVLDFAENYTCKYQDEIQSAHWYHTNATVHPVVAYYACPQCGDTMEESIVFISPDKTHDSYAVKAFMDITVDHLKKKVVMEKIVRFSDGCGVQYKSKGPFYDISCAPAEYNIIIQHEFFGSRHGKGPSDGESAVVKRMASQTVLGGATSINNAHDLYKYCDNHVVKKPSTAEECLHFQRAFYFVDNINRGRVDSNLHTVKGTRQLHSVTGIEEGRILTRNLSCFCYHCSEGSGTCFNRDYVDGWEDVTFIDGRGTKHAQLAARTKVNPSDQSSVGDKMLDATRPVSCRDDDTEAVNSSDQSSVGDKVLDATRPDSCRDNDTEAVNPKDEFSVGDKMPDATGPVSCRDDDINADVPWSVGSWVMVEYDGFHYPGRVISIIQTDSQVECMTASGAYWKWPAQKDVTWYPETSIIKQLRPPIPVSASRGNISMFEDL